MNNKKLIDELTEILNRSVKEIQGEEAAIMIWNAALDTAINKFVDSYRYDGYSIYKILRDLKK